ncbi:deoxyhypusine synthase [Methanolapillus millepedarum]|uniref:Probable deoxyhypusine synthase n=1 Tax=Methanolapillus millepedarum TaxID=3028296 RepID=A0AA96V293_9EURY|nr:Deoxyhypusine synthase-like protein [Methanosarcinaceae archaeon Ac7]
MVHVTEGCQRLTKPVVPADIQAGMDLDEFVTALSGCAFGARRIAEAVDIYTEMLSDKKTVKFLGLAGAMVPAGMRKIIADLIRDGHINVLVTTGANMVHDALEGLYMPHYKGDEGSNDVMLHEERIDRIYDVFLPDQHFEELEGFLQDVIADLPSDRPVSIAEFMKNLGKNIENPDSILRAAYDMNVPIYCPAFPDSVIGLQAWLYKETNPLVIDAIADMHAFMDICWEAEKAGAVFIGGGVPKNFIFQSMLVTPRDFDYAIQLTMDTPQTGGLSGATLEEAISWGKVGSKSRLVTVYSDATITLPLMVGATRARLSKQTPKKQIPVE